MLSLIFLLIFIALFIFFIKIEKKNRVEKNKLREEIVDLVEKNQEIINGIQKCITTIKSNIRENINDLENLEAKDTGVTITSVFHYPHGPKLYYTAKISHREADQLRMTYLDKSEYLNKLLFFKKEISILGLADENLFFKEDDYFSSRKEKSTMLSIANDLFESTN